MKFEKLTEWKTRGGWKAVICDDSHDQLVVLNIHEREVSFHNKDGKIRNFPETLSEKEDGDLIESWKDPVVQEEQ